MQRVDCVFAKAEEDLAVEHFTPIRVVIVDDHQMMREGLRLLLECQSNFEVVGEAKNGEEAIRIVRETKPEVVLMDIQMHGIGGVEATRRIVAELPGVRVICLSMHCDRFRVELALESGARGFVTKGSVSEELHQAIQTVVYVGDVFLSADIRDFFPESCE